LELQGRPQIHHNFEHAKSELTLVKNR